MLRSGVGLDKSNDVNHVLTTENKNCHHFDLFK